ncbi:MAG: hypothetical protein WC683_04955 [bacterium]
MTDARLVGILTYYLTADDWQYTEERGGLPLFTAKLDRDLLDALEHEDVLDLQVEGRSLHSFIVDEIGIEDDSLKVSFRSYLYKLFTDYDNFSLAGDFRVEYDAETPNTILTAVLAGTAFSVGFAPSNQTIDAQRGEYESLLAWAMATANASVVARDSSEVLTTAQADFDHDYEECDLWVDAAYNVFIGVKGAKRVGDVWTFTPFNLTEEEAIGEGELSEIKRQYIRYGKIVVLGYGDGINQVVGTYGSGTPVGVFTDRRILLQETADTKAKQLYTVQNSHISLEIKTDPDLFWRGVIEVGGQVSLGAPPEAAGTYRIEKITATPSLLRIRIATGSTTLSSVVDSIKELTDISGIYMQGSTVAFPLPGVAQNIEKTAGSSFYAYSQVKLPHNLVDINHCTLFWYLDQFRSPISVSASENLGTKTSANSMSYLGQIGFMLAQCGQDWSEPVYMTTTIPNVAGTFHSHIYYWGIYNQSGGSRSYTWALTDETSSATLDDDTTSIGDGEFYAWFMAETTDRRGHTLKLEHDQTWNASGYDEIELFAVTAIQHTHDVAIGSHSHTLSYGTMEDAAYGGSVAVEIKVGSSAWTAVTGSPFTGDQTSVDIRPQIVTLGAGTLSDQIVQVRFLPNANGRAWIRGGGDFQGFVKSR